MANLDLTKYGITGSTVIAHNPSYEELRWTRVLGPLKILPQLHFPLYSSN